MRLTFIVLQACLIIGLYRLLTISNLAFCWGGFVALCGGWLALLVAELCRSSNQGDVSAGNAGTPD